MKHILSFFLIFSFLLSCNKGTPKEESRGADLATSEEETVEIEQPEKLDPQVLATALFLPHRDVDRSDTMYYYNDADDDDSDDAGEGEDIYYSGSHFLDTISTGMYNSMALADSLKLGESWLCIELPLHTADNLPLYCANNLEAELAICETTQYGMYEEVDVFPITLLSSNEEDAPTSCSIAFRGDYLKSDFRFMECEDVSDVERDAVVAILREKVSGNNPAFISRMFSDTLLLNDMYKVDDDVFVANYIVAEFSDSDRDWGNEVVFVVKGSELLCSSSAMSGLAYRWFMLRGQKYFYTESFSYAAAHIDLYKLDGDLSKNYSFTVVGD